MGASPPPGLLPAPAFLWRDGKSYPSYGSNPPKPPGDGPGSAREGVFLLVSSLSNATPAAASPAVFILLKHIPAMEGGEKPWKTPRWPHQPLSPSFQQQNFCSKAAPEDEQRAQPFCLQGVPPSWVWGISEELGIFCSSSGELIPHIQCGKTPSARWLWVAESRSRVFPALPLPLLP